MSTQDTCADISHHQSTVDFKQMSSVIRLLIIRATYGRSADERYAKRPALARSVGMAVGAYHFFRAGHIEEQADFFLETVRPTNGSLCVLDWEREGENPLPSADDALTWLNRVKAKTGVAPLLYSTTALLDAHVPSGHGLHAFPLWLARYPLVNGSMVPSWTSDLRIGSLPKGWDPNSVLLWQYTGAGKVPGVNGNCDRSVGDIEGLIARYPESRGDCVAD